MFTPAMNVMKWKGKALGLRSALKKGYGMRFGFS